MLTMRRACAGVLGGQVQVQGPGNALTAQKRTFKDGKKGRILSWNRFHNPRTFGGFNNPKETWRYANTPGRTHETYAPVPLQVQRNRPALDPYLFKYVGVKTDEKGRPIFDRDRRVRENEIRHEFRSLLTHRNFHGYHALHPEAMRPHATRWNATTNVKGLYY
eukprot:TRINITY_DN16505_c0_g2_i1.p2 TRINITY_DN16505_c0_g2~~TRINITY_DN16505_c0_g2_i1.p2  ORF type:complete len:163 (+),score=44.22 TRINITY_DN16505_c0_g2_i1:61-549(+)